ncbi:hypothetical protein [Ruegeria sp. HKCCD8929]|uniref:hypothetical protein n=1 Tax=Ruegeria sp. HKCCD8929 TaxID=2683006 RepID=UPI001487FF78|nr:hypothetical protein [Ruegeria sp. HKCCD8929]
MFEVFWLRKLSFDWNCVIAVEKQDADSRYIKKIISLHNQGVHEVGLVATSASESLRGSKSLPASTNDFFERIEKLGWGNLPIVPTPAAWGMTYWSFGFWPDEDADATIDKLWRLIAKARVPKDVAEFRNTHEIPEDVPISSAPFSKWRNSWCDVYSAYAHMHAERDFFITTNTRDFQKNADKLAEVGFREALTPGQYLSKFGL